MLGLSVADGVKTAGQSSTDVIRSACPASFGHAPAGWSDPDAVIARPAEILRVIGAPPRRARRAVQRHRRRAMWRSGKGTRHFGVRVKKCIRGARLVTAAPCYRAPCPLVAVAGDGGVVGVLVFLASGIKARTCQCDGLGILLLRECRR